MAHVFVIGAAAGAVGSIVGASSNRNARARHIRSPFRYVPCSSPSRKRQDGEVSRGCLRDHTRREPSCGLRNDSRALLEHPRRRVASLTTPAPPPRPVPAVSSLPFRKLPHRPETDDDSQNQEEGWREQARRGRLLRRGDPRGVRQAQSRDGGSRRRHRGAAQGAVREARGDATKSRGERETARAGHVREEHRRAHARGDGAEEGADRGGEGGDARREQRAAGHGDRAEGRARRRPRQARDHRAQVAKRARRVPREDADGVPRRDFAPCERHGQRGGDRDRGRRARRVPPRGRRARRQGGGARHRRGVEPQPASGDGGARPPVPPRLADARASGTRGRPRAGPRGARVRGPRRERRGD